MMYTNGIGKHQRHWTPAFAGVTLFVVIDLKMLGLSIVDLFGLITLLICLKSISPFERVTLLLERTTLKLSSRRRPGSSVVRTSAINA